MTCQVQKLAHGKMRVMRPAVHAKIRRDTHLPWSLLIKSSSSTVRISRPSALLTTTVQICCPMPRSSLLAEQMIQPFLRWHRAPRAAHYTSRFAGCRFA